VLPTYNTYVTHVYYFSALIIRLVGLVVSCFSNPGLKLVDVGQSRKWTVWASLGRAT
jgi:hypothetical protein